MSMLRVIAAMASKNWTAPEPPPPGDTTPPQVASMVATNATTIRVTFDEPTTATLPGWMFSNGSPVTPSAVTEVNATTWDFTVSGLAHGQTITGSYDAIEGETVDVAGNELASFTGASVTNDIPAPGDIAAPTVVSRTATSSTNMRVVYNEAVNASTAGHLFNNGTSVPASAATQVNATTVDYTVAGLTSTQTITHTYVQQGAGAGTRDTAGNQLAAFSSQPVTNNVPPAAAGPQIAYAYVEMPEPDRIEIAFNVEMDPASIPAAIRFTPSLGRTVLDVAVGAPRPNYWVSLQVDQPYAPGDIITLSYLKPTLNPLQGINGADVESFSNFPIENALGGGGGGDTTPPTVVSRTAISSTNIRVVFDEPVTATIAGWSFNNGGNLNPSSVVQVNANTWDFIVSGLAQGQVITASYDADNGNTVDASNNELASFSNNGVNNQIPPPGGESIPFTVIPFTDPEITSPGRGAEIWHNEFAGNIVNTISESVYESPLDIYARSQFVWDQLETAQGVYDFSRFDALFQWAIPLKKKVGFCIISQWPDRDSSGVVYDGYPSSYPEYLHDLMQAAGGNNTDYVRANTWIPNYNSVHYLSRVEALLTALAAHINNTSYQGVPYSEALGYVDIGLYGSWGEWNQVFVHSDPSDYPAGRLPSAASLIRIIDAHVDAFPNHQVIVNVSALDGRQFPNVWIWPEVGYHALTVENNVGKLGLTKKSWGWPSTWFCEQWIDLNPTVYNSLNFGTVAGNRWQFAPINGEGPGGGTAIDENGTSGFPFMNLLYDQVERYHISQLGNGNFGGEHTGSVQGRDNIRLAWKRMGYRIQIETGTISSTIVKGTPFNVTLNWRNVGVAPVYENWEVRYELQNQSGGAVAYTVNSSHNLRLWLPALVTTPVTDNITIPTNVPAGTYRLVLKIVDPNGYRDPFKLAITGRQADGGYILKSNIAIS